MPTDAARTNALKLPDAMPVRTFAATVAEGQSPQPFDFDGTAVDVFEKAVKFSIKAETHNGAASEIADEQIAAVRAESKRRQCDSPR